MSTVSTWARWPGLAVVAVTALWLGLSGCYPGEAPVSDIVATLHDNDKDFSTYATFTLPDKVVDAGDSTDSGYIQISHQYDDAILQRIRENLESRGWTYVDTTAAPDVALLVSALVSETTNIWYYPPYYGWGWYGGWYGGYYPPYWGYPCCYDVTTYTTGTIAIDMAAVSEFDTTATQTMPIPWAARLNGLANKSNVNQSRIEKAIDQAFAQSPYLDIH